MIAMAIAIWFHSEPWVLGFVMVAVLAGHVWPVQLKFKGGKGLSAAFGAVLMYDYRIALLTMLVAVVCAFASRRITLSFMFGVVCSPLIAYFMGEHWEIVAGLLVSATIIIFAHRDNIYAAFKKKSVE
jgi:glycerol-3-phosphate acyltransferase PlsY